MVQFRQEDKSDWIGWQDRSSDTTWWGSAEALPSSPRWHQSAASIAPSAASATWVAEDGAPPAASTAPPAAPAATADAQPAASAAAADDRSRCRSTVHIESYKHYRYRAFGTTT